MIPSSDQIASASRPRSPRRRADRASAHAACTRPPNGDRTFFFHATATTEIYTLSLHDALPIFPARLEVDAVRTGAAVGQGVDDGGAPPSDRKSTRLNSSHTVSSYAVFCLK